MNNWQFASTAIAREKALEHVHTHCISAASARRRALAGPACMVIGLNLKAVRHILWVFIQKVRQVSKQIVMQEMWYV